MTNSFKNIDYAPGMRIIVRDEEWMIKKVETNALGNKTLYCYGISPLIKDREAMFLTDIEDIEQVDPSKVKLIPDVTPFFKRLRLYIESAWRQKTPTGSAFYIGNKAAMDTDKLDFFDDLTAYYLNNCYPDYFSKLSLQISETEANEVLVKAKEVFS